MPGLLAQAFAFAILVLKRQKQRQLYLCESGASLIYIAISKTASATQYDPSIKSHKLKQNEKHKTLNLTLTCSFTYRIISTLHNEVLSNAVITIQISWTP